MSKWKRFTEADRGKRRKESNSRRTSFFLVVWDSAPTEICHTAYLGNLGESGYYAEVKDVVELPPIQGDKP